MNKGIQMSKGEYIHFLNSGDALVSKDVTQRMLSDLPDCEIIYGNMIKLMPDGKCIYNHEVLKFSLLAFYNGGINHPVIYTKRILFEKFGMYDESLKIVSDWKWYLQVIVLYGIVPVYMDVDVTFFDMTGISSTNSALNKIERRLVLEELFPLMVLSDYDDYSFLIDQLKRLNRYRLIKKLFYIVDRVLFKWEKHFQKYEQ